MGRVFGYLRASTEDQRSTLITQEKALEEAGCTLIFRDDDMTGKTSMTDPDSDWQRLVQTVEAGDVVVVKSHTRLGRKNHQIIYAVGELVEQGVSVRVLDDNKVYDDNRNFEQLINLNLNSAFADKEAQEISSRTKAALQTRSEAGFKLGQKPKLSQSHVAYIHALRATEPPTGIKTIAKAVKVYSKKHGKEMPISTSTVQKVLSGAYGMTVEEWQATNDRARAEMFRVAEAKRRVRPPKEASDA